VTVKTSVAVSIIVGGGDITLAVKVDADVVKTEDDGIVCGIIENKIGPTVTAYSNVTDLETGAIEFSVVTFDSGVAGAAKAVETTSDIKNKRNSKIITQEVVKGCKIGEDHLDVDCLERNYNLD
jgi:hypothetical protein